MNKVIVFHLPDASEFEVLTASYRLRRFISDFIYTCCVVQQIHNDWSHGRSVDAYIKWLIDNLSYVDGSPFKRRGVGRSYKDRAKSLALAMSYVNLQLKPRKIVARYNRLVYSRFELTFGSYETLLKLILELFTFVRKAEAEELFDLPTCEIYSVIHPHARSDAFLNPSTMFERYYGEWVTPSVMIPVFTKEVYSRSRDEVLAWCTGTTKLYGRSYMLHSEEKK